MIIKADVAGTYAGTLGVTLDGEGPISSSQSIELTSPADNKINFVLKNLFFKQVWVVRQVNPYLLEI